MAVHVGGGHVMRMDRRMMLAILAGAVVLWTSGSVLAPGNAPATDQGEVVQLTLAVEGMH